MRTYYANDHRVLADGAVEIEGRWKRGVQAIAILMLVLLPFVRWIPGATIALLALGVYLLVFPPRRRVVFDPEARAIRVDHKGHCLYGSAPTIKICKAVDSPHLKINWDLYHMHITEGDLCGHLREGMPWIGYVQLADHPGRNEPGTGEIHYPRVLQELKKLGSQVMPVENPDEFTKALAPLYDEFGKRTGATELIAKIVAAR